MKNIKFIGILGVLLAITFLAPGQGWTQLFPYSGGAQPKPGTRPPIITHAFAVDKGNYGHIWKIYLEADDPDGNMAKIASVVDGVGYTRYPTDWIFLKAEYRKHFRGYIQW